jgi:hypothetical protein
LLWLGVSIRDNSNLLPRPFDCTPLLVATQLSQLGVFRKTSCANYIAFTFCFQLFDFIYIAGFSDYSFSYLTIPPHHFDKMASGTLDLNFDASPPQSQSPLVRPTRHTADETPTTPKRKRDDESNEENDHTTPVKRPSPPRQIPTPDTLHVSSGEGSLERGVHSKTQLLTPMKRSTSSLQQATPTTIVKGVDRFQMDFNSSPRAADVDIYDPFVTADSMALPPLVRPRMINLTTAAKSRASSDLKPSVSTPVIDLTAVHDDTRNERDGGSVLNNGVVAKKTTIPTPPQPPPHL